MSDSVLFGIILVFLFVLWIYAGGPNHPISFAGPYLTPITDVGQESVGYGPSANDYYKSDSAVYGSYGGSANTDVVSSANSPYAGEVFISSSNPQSSDERDEYIAIRSSSNDDVTVTGWRLVSAKEGTSIRIPEGRTRSSGSTREVRLEEGDEAVITTGSRSNDNDYYSGVWRVYLNKRDDIWRNSNDTITLLDQNGKVVDQYQY